MWVTIEAERILYVDRGRNVILCYRLPEAGTLVLRLSDEQVTTIIRRLTRQGIRG